MVKKEAGEEVLRSLERLCYYLRIARRSFRRAAVGSRYGLSSVPDCRRKARRRRFLIHLLVAGSRKVVRYKRAAYLREPDQSTQVVVVIERVTIRTRAGVRSDLCPML